MKFVIKCKKTGHFFGEPGSDLCHPLERHSCMTPTGFVLHGMGHTHTCMISTVEVVPAAQTSVASPSWLSR